MVGISVDGVVTSILGRHCKLRFPLLADFEPKALSLAGTASIGRRTGRERALFVVAGDGIVRWSYLSPVGVNPGADGILKALEGLGARKSGK